MVRVGAVRGGVVRVGAGGAVRGGGGAVRGGAGGVVKVCRWSEMVPVER